MAFVRLVRLLIRSIGEHDLSGAAAELSYRLFLALFPFLIFLAALGAFIASHVGIDDPTQSIMNQIGQSLPADAASVLQNELDTVISARQLGLVSIGILGAIWAASSGVGTLMKTMNRAYAVKETRPRLKRYALAVGVTLLGGGALIGSFVLFITGSIYGTRIADALHLGDSTAFLLSLARFLLVLLFVLFGVNFLYWAAPNVRLRFRWLSPGSCFFTVGWLLFTYFFGLYVANFGSYDAIYGTLGGVVILMIWFYLTSFLLLVGAEVNVALPGHTRFIETAAPALAESDEDARHEAVGAAAESAVPVLIGMVIGMALRLRPRREGSTSDSAR